MIALIKSPTKDKMDKNIIKNKQKKTTVSHFSSLAAGS